jgi:phosphoglycerate dehydrogenase-like enzyme
MTTDNATKPKVLVLPGPTLYHRLFMPEVDAWLRDLADVTFNERDENWSSEKLASEIAPYEGIVTCWGSPEITPEVLDAAPNLKVIAHSAGSVKGIIKEHVLERGIKVSSASIAMAPAVAEFSLILTFLGLRPIHEYDYGMRREKRPWDSQDLFGSGWEISASRIGVVGVGMVGRLYIAKAKALGADVAVFDPYLPDDAAAELGVTKLSLDDLFETCPIVVIHAPTTPETHHMIGAKQLALLPDNGYLVNTARSWVIDEDALLAELLTGRIRAALDVFDEEPMAIDHPFRDLPNVLLTPHIAGATMQTRIRQGECAVRDLENTFAGRPLAHEVTLERYAILA